MLASCLYVRRALGRLGCMGIEDKFVRISSHNARLPYSWYIVAANNRMMISASDVVYQMMLQLLLSNSICTHNRYIYSLLGIDSQD